MIRVVIDTSVLVSAVISPAGPNAHLFDFIVSKELRPYLTHAVLEADYIVTENSRHFKQAYKLTKIITARQLLKLLGSGSEL